MGLGFSPAQSYNSYITEPLKGLKVYANLRSEKTSGKYESLLFAEAAKFDMEGTLGFRLGLGFRFPLAWVCLLLQSSLRHTCSHHLI